ncbi:SDR family NAD(P)-dependent oxidoreductase [Sorangium sp. So ce1153]|uniref:SDR family NAD(P)-dependent oxidoreductase n=1 Tax=Sorangium sp. So ce1153 TaxID=3133333 RepID=UPI003F5D849F
MRTASSQHEPRSSSPRAARASGPFPYRGRRALVTGASSGIGESFARELAARGMDLVLVARSEGKLRALASELAKRHGVAVEVVASDLSREGAARALHAQCEEKGLHVDLLVNNAAFGTHGPFHEAPLARQHEQVTLNVTAVVDLSHLFLPGMVERGEGGIINVASIAAYQPLPYMATYGATKAFVLSFTEALWAEVRERGVRVIALCPGPVETRFFDVVGTRDVAVGPMATPEQVVLAGLRGLEKGSPSLIVGLRNWVQSNLPRLFPRELALRVTSGIMKPRPPAVLAATSRGHLR